MPVGDPPPYTRSHPAGSTGWECPRCGATYAPWVATCSECKPPAQSLRERIAEAQPRPVLPIPYVPPPVYPLVPAPQWPYGQGVWCYTTPETSTTTANVGDPPRRNGPWTLNQMRDSQDGDDGTAGVPARI